MLINICFRGGFLQCKWLLWWNESSQSNCFWGSQRAMFTKNLSHFFLLPLSPDKKALGIGPKLHIRAKSYLIWNEKWFTLLYAQTFLLEKFVQNVLVNYCLRVSWYVVCQINPKKPSFQHGQEVFSCLYVCISFRNHTRMIADGVTGSRIAQR